MATISMASYPHIETNVIDESIYQYSNTRILPLQRDLFTVRAQKGRVGVLAWYDQYIEAETALGAETFNNLNSKYCSNDSIFVKNVMANNGCFIVRLAERESMVPASTNFSHDGITERKGALKALQILEAVVKCGSGDEFGSGADVPLYERTSTGGILRNDDGNPIEYRVDAETGEHVSPFIDGSDSLNPDNPNWEKAVAKTVKGIFINWRWRYAYIPKGGPGHDAERETIANMAPYVIGTGSDQAKVFPMIVFEASSPGSWGDDNCLELFYDSSINNRDEVQLLGNVQYTLRPKYKVYGKSSVNAYFDKRGNNAVNFVMEPGKIDDRYESMIALNDVLDDSYDLANPLPWDVTYFNENWEFVCGLAQKFEKKYYADTFDAADTVITLTDGTEITNRPNDGVADADTDGVAGVDTFVDPTTGEVLKSYEYSAEQTRAFNAQTAFYNAQADLEKPWMLNIVSGQNLDGALYYAVVVNGGASGVMPSEPDTDSLAKNDDGTLLHTYLHWKNADLVSDVLHYALNGRDGSLSDWDHEQNIRDFYNCAYQFESTWNPKNILDRGHFPFNTIFDTGYQLETKKALCDFLTAREDVKIVLSTQSCTKYLAPNGNVMQPVMNTMAQDESVGTALQSRVQLMRESVIKGTACCRATIFAHSGILFGTYKGIVPMTIWSAIKGSEHYNTTMMNGTNKGWPNSHVNIFKELNWVAPDEASHERHWNLGINYVQHYDMDNLFFPSIRTVYKYDTSVLLDDEFTDAIVFTKQAARDSWATFTGMDTPQAEYEAIITADLTQRLNDIFNGRYTFNVEAYQTVEEKKRGYVQHIAITIWAPAVKRVWLVDVICRRENFDAAAEATA